MRPETVHKFSSRVPRYTSYPTAQSFQSDVTAADYAQWLSELQPGEPVSLYVHIPFCGTLCWYCGCTTKMVKRYDPVPPYIDAVKKEVSLVRAAIGRRQSVAHIHFGGGSPNILSKEHILSLADHLRQAFAVADDAEFAVEIDPRLHDPEKVEAFVEAGVNRVSLGVQDFSEDVQQAINRRQSFEDTKRVANAFRSAGAKSLNIDLVYGLPFQTRASVRRTIEDVQRLNPDRIALFGYAHMPARASHQRQIDEAALPNAIERYAQASRAAHLLEAAGYVRVGLDHFAKPTDDLARAPVRRNFQGYTSDDSKTLIGLGASSIGTFKQGYAQNEVATGRYIARIQTGELATGRGIALSDDDRARALIINKLMCEMRFPGEELRDKFPANAAALFAEAEALIEADEEALLEKEDAGFKVTEKGRPFLRSVCACFDTYLESSPQDRFSVGV